MAKSPKLQRLELTLCSIPDDIVLKIASFLPVSDICSLGCCSRFWRDLWSSNFMWISLSKQRWPSFDFSKQPLDSSNQDNVTDHTKEWRNFYIKRHKVMASEATSVVKFVKQCSHRASLEVGNYLRAIEDLRSKELGFKDVQLFLFTAKQNVLLNLIGLHYSLFCLGIPAEDVMSALLSCQVAERQVYVKWLRLSEGLSGFRFPVLSQVLSVSLGSLAMGKEDKVLGVLRRGAGHGVLEAQISALPFGTFLDMDALRRIRG